MNRKGWAALSAIVIVSAAAGYGYAEQLPHGDGLCTKLPKLNVPTRYRATSFLRHDCPWAVAVDDRAAYFGVMVIHPHGIGFLPSPTPGRLPADLSWTFEVSWIDLETDQAAERSLTQQLGSADGAWFGVKLRGWAASRRDGRWWGQTRPDRVILVDRFIEVTKPTSRLELQ